MTIQSDKFFKVIKDGACRNLPTVWFFPDQAGKVETLDSTKKAREACKVCAINSVCFDHAVRHEDYGIWAGLSPHERRVWRKVHKVEFLSLTVQAESWAMNYDRTFREQGRD